MDRISQLELSTLESYQQMGNSSDGSTIGGRLFSGADMFANDLGNVSRCGFSSDDESTAHAVIDEVNLQMIRFREDVNALNLIMDSLIDDINQRIIGKEDEFAASLSGKL